VEALPPGIEDFICGGVSIVVATRDDALRPELGRAWGPLVEGGTVTLCVATPAGSAVRANLEANGAIAATCSLPTTYQAVQLKGRALDVRDAGPEDEARASAHLDAFMAEVAQIGMSQELRRTVVGGPLFTVAFAVAELYDQTPGPGAGGRL
jgi:hypothetical protein